MDVLQRFSRFISVNPTTGCHEWIGARNDRGYGQFSVKRNPLERLACPRGGNKRVRAHRWLWEHVYGKLARGLEIDHKCCNPGCVNLAHLQVVTKAENLALRGRVHMEIPLSQANCAD